MSSWASALRRRIRLRVRTALPSLSAFIDGTVYVQMGIYQNSLVQCALLTPLTTASFVFRLYILSREWHDIFSIQVLRLHPLPFCSEDASGLPCTREASSAHQAKFAVAVLVVASVLQPIATAFERVNLNFANVPSMLSMIVGWATGFAAVQLLRELDDLPGDAHSNLVNMMGSAFATVIVAALILTCQPATWSEGWASVVSSRLNDVWRLLSGGLSFAVMMLWNASITDALLDAVPQEQRQGPVFQRMLLFFAASLTAACSLISVRLVRLRKRLQVVTEAEGKEDLDLESEASSATRARVHDSTRAPHTPASHLC